MKMESTLNRQYYKHQAAASLLALACLRPASADITLKMVDAASKPIAGVSCTQTGGGTAVSDATGNLVISPASSISPRGRMETGFSMSRIPVAAGEKATLEVIDTRGRKVLHRRIGLGDRIEFAPEGKGVYFVRIAGRNHSVSGRLADLGRGMFFEGVFSATPAAALAKASAAADLSVTCSKSGMPTQIYRVADGSSTTIDFSKPALVPLYDGTTKLEPDNVFETATALVTRFSDRARDRHAREDQFKAYDHYLTFYWENRTAIIQITDEVAKGGKKIRIDQWTLWPLDPTAREFRAFYRGIGTVAEYHHNVSMSVDPADPLHYFTEFSYNPKMGRAIQKGDKMEIEVSQFLKKEGLVGRDNYYGTTYLYMVGGGGMVPWDTRGIFGDASTEREDSYPLPEETWLGGRTTVHQQFTDEPDDVFMQMATNLAPQNGQIFVHGRRVLHTNFVDGAHDEPGNPVWDAHAGKAGPKFVNISCSACHHKNGRAIPPATGTALTQYVFKVGDAEGNPHPQLGSVFQPKGSGEGTVTLSGWTEADGLRKPTYAFSGGTAPANHSARISPQLVGMGLLEAIPETAIQALADPDDADKDGISGRMHIVTDYVTGMPRIGRFGWKAGKPDVAHQVAGALNSDIGVMTSIYPSPDCGSAQGDCGKTGSELPDENLRNLIDYISLLGVRARRDIKDPSALQGEALFKSAGCASCHTPTMTTGRYHPKAELRNQTIHAYTDLLLHDMGPGLADNLPEGQASGSEWRTAPLWNIGMTAGVSGGEGYLHDGRARTLNEAILWHGGEAAASAKKFKDMSSGDAAALVKFLKSL
jgi:CxxC motif-containing protein (DUF1111 family)